MSFLIYKIYLNKNHHYLNKTEENMPIKTIAKFLSTILLGLTLYGCAGFQPALVTEHTISNPTMGFSGYETAIPPGYLPIEFVNASTEEDSGFIEKAKNKAQTMRTKSLYRNDLRDLVILYNQQKKSVLVFALCRAPVPVPLMDISDFDLRHLLKQIKFYKEPGVTGTWQSTRFDDRPALVFKGTGQSGFNRVGMSDAIFLGPLHELFIVRGVSKNKNPAIIRQDIDFIMQNTVIK